MFTRNATENTVVMINKEVNSLVPKWSKGKLEVIDRGQDTQAQVMFSIVSTSYIQSTIFFGYTSFYFTFTTDNMSIVQACNVLRAICLVSSLFGLKIPDSKLKKDRFNPTYLDSSFKIQKELLESQDPRFKIFNFESSILGFKKLFMDLES